MTVSIPDKIALSLLPHNNWVTVEGEHHDIAIDLFTNKNQKITLGDKYKFKSTFDVNMFLEERRNKNASRIFGEAVTAGSNPITASFENLKTNAEMLVFKGIDLYPKLVLLPYDTERVNLHKVQFVATGGDGSFVWSGSDTNVQVSFSAPRF